jgi:hypothetical protein
MKKTLFSFFIIAITLSVFSFCNFSLPTPHHHKHHTSLVVTRSVELPDKIEETSGLIRYKNYLWTFNDSGGDPEIYAVSEADSSIKHTVMISNGENADWEEISQDDENIYVCDFGNNFGTRHTLCIYKIAKSKINLKKNISSVIAEKIQYTYPNYTPELIPSKRSSFDCEAMICANDSIYIFSKDWVNFTSTIYRLPKTEGKYEALKVGHFNSNCLITAATFTGKKLFLLGYMPMYPVIYTFSIDSVFNPNNLKGTQYDIKSLYGTQCEGISVIDDDNLVISSERTGKHPYLYYLRFEY